MADAVQAARVALSRPFSIDARTGELANSRRRITLRDQGLPLLLALVERPGELVTDYL